jgi:hypothetical protein
MKTLGLLSLGLAFGLSAQADLIKFQLSPAGTDAGVGLSPSNTVPPATGSTGSGGAIASGIAFDPDSRTLFIAVGYGSAAGFTDLTAPEATSHIHFGGPGTNGNVQIDLHSIHYPATNPASGGVFVGSVLVDSNDVPNLLAGLLYLDIHTSNYFSGELRGQLIAMSGAPLVVCPSPAVLDCASSATLVALTSDPEGEALSVVWSVNGAAVATNTVPASVPCLPAMTTLTQDFPLGTNVLLVTVTDASGNVVSCSTTITVQDTNPPVIVSAAANPSTLCPANNKLVDVKVTAVVADTCGATTWKIIGVSSNERAKGKKCVSKDSDWVITGDHIVKLRAEEGNIYTIKLQAQDASGNLSATNSVSVSVTKSSQDGNRGNGNNNNSSHGNNNHSNSSHGNSSHGNGDHD